MKNTEIIFVIDKSGSMSHLTNDTIGGFNGFIASQKALEGKATLTTVLFDTTWKLLHDGADIQEVTEMTSTDYVAGGGTAMLDAIGDIINRVQDRHDELGAEKPEKVLLIITTDGEENSSRKFTKNQIEKMIKHQTNGHGWEVMFLGANMDAVKEAEGIGIATNRSVTYDWTTMGTQAMYDTVTLTACAARCDKLDADFDLSATYKAAVSDNARADAVNAINSQLATDISIATIS
jgi:uncharacterized protein YegL